MPHRWFDLGRGGLGGRMALSLTLALLPVGLLAMVQSFQGFQHARELEKLAIFGAAERALNRADRSLNDAQGATRVLGSVLLPVVTVQDGICSQQLGDLVARDGRMLFAGYLEPDAALVCSSRGAGSDLAADPSVFAELTRNAGGVLYLQTPFAPGPAVHITKPVTSAGQRVGWMLTVWPEGHFYSDPVDATVTDTALVDRRGTVFAPSSPASVPAGMDLAELHGGGRRSFNAESLAGTRMQYAAVPLAGGGLTALAARPYRSPSPYFTGGAYLLVLALPLLMWGISLFVAVLSTNRLATGPLKRLMKMTRAMSHGVRDLSGIRLQGAPTELQNLSDRFVEMSQRVTRYEGSLETALEEKTVLLREVHHRVRNNLQLLVSVLNMQERAAASSMVKDAMARFRQRVLGLSAAHEHLYEVEVMARGLDGRLVADVVRTALASSGTEARLSIEEVTLPQESAVPLALFVAEAIAEAVSFAAEAERGAELRVTLAADGSRRARLVIEATPSGRGSAPVQVDELGPRLMQALAAQLGGDFSRQPDGHHYRVELGLVAAATAPRLTTAVGVTAAE